jgi:hypothetical protein
MAMTDGERFDYAVNVAREAASTISLQKETIEFQTETIQTMKETIQTLKDALEAMAAQHDAVKIQILDDAEPVRISGMLPPHELKRILSTAIPEILVVAASLEESKCYQH